LTGARGALWDRLVIPAGGHALPIRKDIADIEILDSVGNVWHLWEDIMKGIDVFKFTTEVGPRGIRDIVSLSGKTMDEIDYFAFHQANKQIIRSVAGYADLPRDKFSWTAFSSYGNCGAAAIVTDICHNLAGKDRKAVVLSSFGVGLSWGFALLDMSSAHVEDVSFYTSGESNMTREQRIRYWIDYYKGGGDA
jgi:3-oxoacyl-[acyl-carrier-protein] synthase-3